jgi:hypothetical protein
MQTTSWRFVSGNRMMVNVPPSAACPAIPERHHLVGDVGLAEQVDEPLDPLDEDVAAGS